MSTGSVVESSAMKGWLDTLSNFSTSPASGMTKLIVNPAS